MSGEFPFDHFLRIPGEETNKFQGIEPLKVNDAEQSETHDDMDDLNNEILNVLKDNIVPQKFTAYFKDTFRLKSILGNRITFAVTTPFIRSMIERHYTNVLETAVEQTLGSKFKIIIDIKQNQGSLSSNDSGILNSLRGMEREQTTEEKPKTVKDAKFTLDLTPSGDDLISSVESKYIDHMTSEYPGMIVDPKKTFETFIVGPSNNMAFATAMAVAKEPSRPGFPGRYPSLYFHSNSGLGKTHLLHAVANSIRENFPSLVVCLITAREFMKEMIDHIQEKSLPEFQKKYSEKIDVLMIDDIHELKNKTGTQNEFFHIFNELHNKCKQLIFTSDKLPKEIDGIAERIRTRLQWGLVQDIQRPDIETRIAILKKKSDDLDLFLTDDIINLIAANIKNSIRELEGSLIKLSAYSEVMRVEIDQDVVRELLALKGGQSYEEITLESVAKAVAKHFKIPMADLKSKVRTKNIARARHISMYLAQKVIGSKLQEIGLFFGGRDHTSVLHGIRKVQDSLKTDTTLSKDILTIENNIK